LLRSRTTRVAAATAGLLVSYVIGVVVRGHYGTRVVVRNQAEEMLRNVSVKVEARGQRYPMPDLAMAQKAHVFAQPVGESQITLEFDDEHGHHHRELLVGYLEAGDCGGAEATVWPNGLVESRENAVRLVCWGSWLEFF
jgi:hypothetical protein